MLADIASGEVDVADWLFLIAAIVFAVVAFLAISARPDPSKGALSAVGLCLLAVGWLLL